MTVRLIVIWRVIAAFIVFTYIAWELGGSSGIESFQKLCIVLSIGLALSMFARR